MKKEKHQVLFLNILSCVVCIWRCILHQRRKSTFSTNLSVVQLDTTEEEVSREEIWRNFQSKHLFRYSYIYICPPFVLQTALMYLFQMQKAELKSIFLPSFMFFFPLICFFPACETCGVMHEYKLSHLFSLPGTRWIVHFLSQCYLHAILPSSKSCLEVVSFICLCCLSISTRWNFTEWGAVVHNCRRHAGGCTSIHTNTTSHVNNNTNVLLCQVLSWKCMK